MVHMNEVYLRETGGTPPFAGDHWRRITSQIVTMLLPLYNMVGEEFTDSIPSLEKFCQGLGNIVSYAAWLAITTHLTPGITVLEWLPPGDDYRLEQSNVLHDVFERSRAKARKYDKRIGASKPRTGRVKISVAPSIVYYPPPKPGSKAEGYFEGYRVLRPHAVYYFGLLDSIEDAKTLVPLWDYLRRVSKRRGSPPALLVLLICVSAWCLFWKGLIYLWDEAAYGAWSVTLFAKINEGW